MGNVLCQETGPVGSTTSAWYEVKTANLLRRAYMLKTSRELDEKCEKVSNTGGIPGQFLGSHAFYRLGINTSVCGNDRARE